MLKAYIQYSDNQDKEVKERLISVAKDKEDMYSNINKFIEDFGYSRHHHYIILLDNDDKEIERVEVNRNVKGE